MQVTLFRHTGRRVENTLTHQTGHCSGMLHWVRGMLVTRITYDSGNSGYARTDMLRYI